MDISITGLSEKSSESPTSNSYIDDDDATHICCSGAGEEVDLSKRPAHPCTILHHHCAEEQS